MVEVRRVVIVGASLAGLTAAETLRDAGYEGTITVVEAASSLPPDRPPLSKQVLSGEWEPHRAAPPSAERIDDFDLDLRFGVRAAGLDVGGRRLELPDGTLRFDRLLVATGASPRHLSRPEAMEGIHVLRTMEDCLAIRSDLDAEPGRVVVVGAGFIGAEVAATCRSRGLEVTVLEALDVALGRVLGPEIGGVVGDIHRDNGVDLKLGVGVEGFEGSDRVGGVRLNDGSLVAADVVVVGVGVVPNTGWLAGSGLTVDDGVVCDETCLAAPGVAAAGDVARWPNQLFGRSMRVEHWDNALEQGAAAARRLLAGAGEAVPYAPVPWFWSDQYDRKIQLAGWIDGADECKVVEGSLPERRFVAAYRRGPRLTGVLGMNRPRQVMQFRTRIAEGITWDDALAELDQGGDER
ncbi:MAG: Rhodocoxin reductase [Acidimicrobiales bacterium]|nr:Rhodocoxin reductase [Acidimicrobiales bacterium]